MIDYTLTSRIIGRGAFSIVYLGKDTYGRLVAIKSLDTKKYNARRYKYLDEEIRCMTNLRHPHIVSLIDVKRNVDSCNLILEYCEGGDLSSAIETLESRRVNMREENIRRLLVSLVSALSIMKMRNIVHRDIKPGNVLLTSMNIDTCVFKLGDFTFAKETEDLAETYCGSPLYMAPEVMERKPYDCSADVWSLGILLFHVTFGHVPFKGSNIFELRDNITSGKMILPSKEQLKKVPTDIMAVIKAALQHDPKLRIGIDSMLNTRTIPVNIPVMSNRTWTSSAAKSLETSDRQHVRTVSPETEIHHSYGAKIIEEDYGILVVDSPRKTHSVPLPNLTYRQSTPKTINVPKTNPFKPSSAPSSTKPKFKDVYKDLYNKPNKKQDVSKSSITLSSSVKSNSVLYSDLLEDLTEVSKLAISCNEIKKYTMATSLFIWISKFASRHASVDYEHNDLLSCSSNDPFKEKKELWIKEAEKNLKLALEINDTQTVDFRDFVFRAGLDCFVRSELLAFMDKDKELLPSIKYGDWPNPPTFVGMYEAGCRVLRVLLEDHELEQDRSRICDYLAKAKVAFTQRR